MITLLGILVHIILNMYREGYGQPRERGSKAIHSKRTRDIYRAAVRQFCRWLIDVKHCDPYMKMDDARMYIQEYLDCMGMRGLRWATIHTALAGLCKVFGCKMSNYVIRVEHLAPVKGRVETELARKAEKEHLLVAMFCRVVGIRRDECVKLTAKDFVYRHGLYWVIVRQGKGGKVQYQLIPKQWAAFVESFFLCAGKNERVFKAKELKNLPIHRYRRELAQEMYFLYLEILQNNPDAARIFEEMIRKTMQRAGVDPRSKPDMQRLSKPYHTQGQVRQSMIDLGMPTTYDRLALMMVAVYHLAHWRVNVVVQNYMR